MNHRSRTLPILIALALAISIAITAPSTPAVADSDDGQYRHESGLIIVSDLPRLNLDSQGRDAYGLALTLADQNPTVFGYPTVNGTTVIVPTIVPELSRVKTSYDVASALVTFTDRIKKQTISTPLDPSKRLTMSDIPIETNALAARANFTKMDLTFAQVQEAKDQAFDLYRDRRFVDAGIWQSQVDHSTGAVILTVERLTNSLAKELVRRFGTESIRVRIAPRIESLPARQNDSSPYYGGARILTPGGGSCSAGFSWYSGSVNMMLTAAHCSPAGGTFNDPDGTAYGTVASGTRENWTSGTGTDYYTGQSTYRGDAALITMSGSLTTSGRIFSAGPNSYTSIAVASMWSRRASPGDEYCTGGQMSGSTCGWTVDYVGINHLYSNGETLRNGVESEYKSDQCIIPGDSGGSVYTIDSNGKAFAKGIISGSGGGGSDHWGGLLDPCIMWFTDIYDPYTAFPGLLRTS